MGRYFRTCERCGAHLDPNERCDCQREDLKLCKRNSTRNISGPQHGKRRKDRGWSLMASGVSCAEDTGITVGRFRCITSHTEILGMRM